MIINFQVEFKEICQVEPSWLFIEDWNFELWVRTFIKEILFENV